MVGRRIERILIGKRGDLLLLYFIVGEGLLVLLPILAGGGRLRQSVTSCPLDRPSAGCLLTMVERARYTRRQSLCVSGSV